ncbi:DEAD/DEAH box helicase [Aquisalimonas asiatica]|uniref:AAA domain-containing protein n=1 Tax=Aquisalimonas asiatica TaxID=406100 RepID=A0A1H8VSH9_9GAMM|nr:AAA domain-containing protein [Aquisalimonas asiatica]SEP18351.1 AAA domain-containing protein [Aquisalimonas asiatica]
MGRLQNLTSYFRKSLIDAEHLCPDDKDLLPLIGPSKESERNTPYKALAREDWLKGQIPRECAEAILGQKQGKHSQPLREVELAMFPRVDLIRYHGGSRDSRKRRVLLPLVVFVRMDSSGQLWPSGKAPWIPREWLGPNQSSVEPIADVVAVDAFMTKHPFEGIETWPELVAYCTRLLCWVTDTPYLEADEQEPGTSLFDFDIHSGYELTQQSLLQVEDLPVVGAKDKMLRVLDALSGMQEPPLLYQRFADSDSPGLEPYQDLESSGELAARHVGQMTGEFPLSPKQRNALHHFLMQQDGEILAVNGPPGTGKTTLLRSVVATLWTQAALEEVEPPLIVAASNNNQAVTNILESFAKVDEGGLDERLAGRWLPEVNSYGLYCCAKSKANDQNPFLYHGPEGEGAMKDWQTRDFFERARAVYLERASRWKGTRVADLADARKALHRAMEHHRKQMVTGLELLGDFQAIQQEVVASHGGLAGLQAEIVSRRAQKEEREIQHKELQSRLDQIYALWESRPLWVRLLSLVPGIGPSVRQQEHRKTARLLNRWDMSFDDHSDAAVEGWFQARLNANRKALRDLTQSISDLEACGERYQATREKLDGWIAYYQPDNLNSEDLVERVHVINDCVLRFELFKLATHYWEARWLMELDDFLTANDTDKKSPFKVQRKLRRFAKLTPCFVSTFYMTPSTLMAYERQDQAWKDIPLFGEVDLLIVDEAGQALPEVSAPTFSLAKRALVVGDTDQIEPVWSVPAGVDRANLELFNLLNDERADEYSYDDFWLTSGLLASSGNLMRIAQRQCRYHQVPKLQRGLYLTEHRRCFDDIIDYCNALVYEGELKPRRGRPEKDVPSGTLSLVPVDTPSRSYGGSRGNPGEAERIARWLNVERQRILDYARGQEPKLKAENDAEVLKKTVGIVTPFSKQAALIRSELREAGINGLTVGTVHSLQGDERLLVLFSSVYGVNEKGSGKFYDRGHNMLNVAVSRAKDSFVVFGSLDVFGQENRNSPSGLLRRRLSVLGEPEADLVN